MPPERKRGRKKVWLNTRRKLKGISLLIRGEEKLSHLYLNPTFPGREKQKYKSLGEISPIMWFLASTISHLLLALLLSSVPSDADVVKDGSTCTVTPLASGDDANQIISAFQQCGRDASIVFQPGTYHVGKVMDMEDLRNVDVSLQGTFIWSTDIQYWLRNSISVTYAGRSAAWRIGGNNITIRGHGKTLFDGNGQTWYDQNRNQGNQNGRPISLALWYANDILIDGIEWKQPQFW